MAYLAIALSVILATLGALGVVWPDTLLGAVRTIETPVGLYASAATRLVFGASLYLAAPHSRAPRTLRVLGVAIFFAGLITPLIGLERFVRLLQWWSSIGSGFTRVLAFVALAFALWLIYALLPKSRDA